MIINENGDGRDLAGRTKRELFDNISLPSADNTFLFKLLSWSFIPLVAFSPPKQRGPGFSALECLFSRVPFEQHDFSLCWSLVSRQAPFDSYYRRVLFSDDPSHVSRR
jgi:hypothetical protein